MNWQTYFGYSTTADWILLAAFHSLWISLVVFLIIHIRRFRAPAERSAWCVCSIILLLILPLITYFVPQAAGRAHLDQKVDIQVSSATADAKSPLWNGLLNLDAALPRSLFFQPPLHSARIALQPTSTGNTLLSSEIRRPVSSLCGNSIRII